MIYLIGSLRNPAIPALAKRLSDMTGKRIFADWYAAGPHADDAWRDYEKGRGLTFEKALNEPAAENVFAFDKRHLEASQAVVLVAPAGKSAHMELGWCLGKGIPGAILLDSPDRWDVMYRFADCVTRSETDLCRWIADVCQPPRW